MVLALISHGDDQHRGLKNQFISLVNEKEPKYQIIGVLCLGEFGKLEDLSEYKQQDLFAKVQSFFESPSEEVRSAASIGLGKITVGNLYFYLNKVMEMI